MRVICIGATGFGLRCFETILSLKEIQIVGVVTNSKSFHISYSQDKVTNYLYEDIAIWAKKKNISCYCLQNNMHEEGLKEWVSSLDPDYLIVIGWYHMIPPYMRAIAPALGLHASLLPDYSGGAPLVWAIINGETATGITLFQLDDGVDSGPIFGQLRTPIYYEDTIATLYKRIENLAKNLLLDKLVKIAKSNIKPIKQDDSKRRIFPQRTPDDGLINWQMSSIDIYNFIRAQTKPYPGAFSYLWNKKIIIWACHGEFIAVEKRYPTGTILFSQENQKVQVVSGDNQAIVLDDFEIDGAIINSAEQYQKYIPFTSARFMAYIKN